MYSLLRLTAEEKAWNSYYDDGAKLGVKHRRYVYQAPITAAAPAFVNYHVAARRSRIWGLAFSGDVYAVKCNIFSSTGEKLTVAPCHLPLLSGHAPHSTRSRSTAAFSAQANSYPTVANGVTSTTQYGATWRLLLEPNLVMGGLTQLHIEWTLEDPSDAVATSYLVTTVVECWEFPGFQAGAK